MPKLVVSLHDAHNCMVLERRFGQDKPLLRGVLQQALEYFGEEIVLEILKEAKEDNIREEEYAKSSPNSR